MADTFAALSTATFNLNSLLPPVFGGVMYDNFGFKITLYASMIMVTIVAILFAVVNMGC